MVREPTYPPFMSVALRAGGTEVKKQRKQKKQSKENGRLQLCGQRLI